MPPITYVYQWRRDGASIGGATNSSYVLAVADIGAVIDCNVSATNSAGSAAQHSNDIAVADDLSASLASAVFDLDATLAASYPGTGTTWANLVSAPADGAGQTDYDFFRGEGSTSTKYPTFNGSAGDAAAYWSLDGGDWFQIKSGSNTAFLNNLHKTTGGQDFWIAITGRYISTASASLFSTRQFSGTVNGIDFLAYNSASGKFQVRQRGATAEVTISPTPTVAAGNDFILIVSHSHSGNYTRFYLNSTSDTGAAHTFNAGTNTPARAVIGALDANGVIPVPNTFRIYSAAGGNEYLDDTKAAAIIAHLEARHGRDYTP